MSFLEKLPLYVRIGYGLLIVFAMVGVLAGHQGGVLVAVLTVLMWTMTRILQEAAAALTVLRIVKQVDEENKQSKGDDDQEPPAA